MINSVDPEEITQRNQTIINGLKGIKRGKIFSDFDDIKEHVKKMIRKGVVENPEELKSCINQIEPLFKKM